MYAIKCMTNVLVNIQNKSILYNLNIKFNFNVTSLWSRLALDDLQKFISPYSILISSRSPSLL